MGWFSKRQISEIKPNLSRDELIRRGRILIIDDERPELIDDLIGARFAVTHVEDITKTNIGLIDNPVHDLFILDFGNVGTTFGNDEGLSLLRYIKRVNPSSVVYSYTSKALKSKFADFYRLTDGNLQKDAGIQESTEKIEEGLKKALSIDNLWAGMLGVAQIKSGSKEDLDLQDSFVKAVNKQSKIPALKSKVSGMLNNDESKKIGATVLEKLIEVSIKSIIGA